LTKARFITQYQTAQVAVLPLGGLQVGPEFGESTGAADVLSDGRRVVVGAGDRLRPEGVERRPEPFRTTEGPHTDGGSEDDREYPRSPQAPGRGSGAADSGAGRREARRQQRWDRRSIVETLTGDHQPSAGGNAAHEVPVERHQGPRQVSKGGLLAARASVRTRVQVAAILAVIAISPPEIVTDQLRGGVPAPDLINLRNQRGLFPAISAVLRILGDFSLRRH
jgi:hypothetical protein